MTSIAAPSIATIAKLLPAGDAALVIEFGDRIDPRLSAEVNAAARAIAAARLPGVGDVVPTFRSILLRYDPLVTSHGELAAALAGIAVPTNEAADVRTTWRIPVLYGGNGGPDLDHVAEAAGISPDEVARGHAETVYHVYMLGFVPGFAYLGDLAPALRLPRRKNPRARVPAGSVAIALQMTAIYPRETPGGWHLIGHTPLRLFDLDSDPPALLAPGDRVRFVSVDAAEHERIARAIEAGQFTPEREGTAG